MPEDKFKFSDKEAQDWMKGTSSGTYYLNEDKTYRPCTVMEWGNQTREMMENKSKHVAQDKIDGHFISTTWLGLDHSFMPGDTPVLFETMIFENGNWREIYQRRYSTWIEAEEGHKKAIQWVKDGCKDD